MLEKQNQSRHGWVEKMIHWELCKRLKFYHTNKWYVYKPDSILENETHNILWDFEIETGHQISAIRSDLVLSNKKKITHHLVDFDVLVDHKVKTLKKKRKVLWSCKKPEKPVEHEGDSVTNRNRNPRNDPQRTRKRLAELEVRIRIQTLQTTVLIKSRVQIILGDMLPLRLL